LNVQAAIPYLIYNGNTLNNFTANIQSDKNMMRYAVSLGSMKSGNIHLSKTTLAGNIQNNTIDFSVNITDKESGNKLLIAGNVKQEEQGLFIRLDEKKLVFNNQRWQIPDDNYIKINNEGLYVHQFTLSNTSQQLALYTDGE